MNRESYRCTDHDLSSMALVLYGEDALHMIESVCESLSHPVEQEDPV